MSAGANLSEEIVSQLLALERSLLDPELRRDRARVSELLAKDFFEFGSSGRVWTRDRILELLATEEAYVTPAIENFECRSVGPETILATYRAVRADELSGARTVTLRSSLWTNESGAWRVLFHQGTRVP
jgi:hypothetical protein